MKPNESRIALICGGGGALGSSVSEALASSGFVVAVADLDYDAAQRVTKSIAGDRGAHAFVCDMSDPESVGALSKQVTDEVGPPDVLVNLTGIVRNATLGRVTDEDFESVHRSHVVATLATTRTFSPVMKSRGYGRIINTSSVASLGTRGGTAYSAAKGAIEAMTRTAALELATSGVTVNCVAPGVIDAGMFRQLPPEYQDQVESKIPTGRSARPQEVAAAYDFLASEAASYVTGQTLTVCGGLSVGALD